MLRPFQRWGPNHQDLFRKIFPRSLTTVAVETEDAAKARAPGEIPGPLSLPLIGTLYKYLPFGEYKSNRPYPTGLAMMKKYGKLVREEMLPGINILHSFDPDILQKMVQNEGKYPFRPVTTPLLEYRIKRNLPTGLGNSNGEEWYHTRKLLNQQMMRPKNVEVFIPVHEEVSEDFIHRMRKLRDTKREIPNFTNELYKWSCESMGIVCYDTRLGILSDSPTDTIGHDFVKFSEESFRLMQQAVEVDMICKVLGIKNIHERKVTKTLDEGWQKSQKLIEAAWERNKTHEDTRLQGKGSLLYAIMSIPDIKLEDAHIMVNDLFFGGIDSTGSTMGFLLYNLARNPVKQEVLRQEVLQVAPPGTKITAEVLRNMPYLRACARESQRILPTAVFGTARILTKDLVLGGYKVPAGWIVISHNDVMSRMPEFFPEPDSFLPERWLRNSSTIPRHHFASLPFGFGARMCIGRRLAEQAVHIITAKIMQNFKMDYKYGDIHAIARLFNRPDKPVRISFSDI